jgi:hypothetical protein
VREHKKRFEWLSEGERVVGEWLAQAHGTRYALTHEPFVAFDVMEGTRRLPYTLFVEAAIAFGLPIPRLIHRGGPFGLEAAQLAIKHSGHGALDPVEGAVWRVERRGVVDFLAKWVRHDKVDGCYLPEVSGAGAVWNWRPS